MSFLVRLENDHSYYTDSMIRIHDYARHMSEEGNAFLDRRLRLLSASLIKSLDRLGTFCALQFFVHPANQTGNNMKLCLQPDLNIDRGARDMSGSDRYDQLTAELEGHIKATQVAYRAFRRRAKKWMLI